MKTKYLLLGMSALLAAGGLCFGRAAWRAHHQLVTLHVRNLPLADVLRKIEHQTWEKIRTEKNLDARITLNVTDKPLSDVLDRIAEQAGARWVTLYAVYNSRPALEKLDSALRTDGKIEAAGWTKVAPAAADLKLPGHEPLGEVPVNGPGSEAGIDETRLPPGAAVMTATEDVDVKGPPGTNSAAAGSRPMQRRGPMVLRIARKGGPGGSAAVEQEVWTPEELVMESALSARLSGEDTESATPEAASQAARKVGGHWTTYFALHKSPLGLGFSGAFQPKRMARLVAASGQHGTNFSGPEMSPALEDPLAHQRNAEFDRLTPQQRVERARERLRMQQN